MLLLQDRVNLEAMVIKVNFIGLMGRVFANGPGDLGSIPSRVIPKTFKMVLDTSLLNTQQYKVRIKGKVEQFRERSSALPYTTEETPPHKHTQRKRERERERGELGR